MLHFEPLTENSNGALQCNPDTPEDWNADGKPREGGSPVKAAFVNSK